MIHVLHLNYISNDFSTDRHSREDYQGGSSSDSDGESDVNPTGGPEDDPSFEMSEDEHSSSNNAGEFEQ